MHNLANYTGTYCTAGGCNVPDFSKEMIFGLVAMFGFMFFVMILLAMAVFGFWVWMLIDAFKRPEESYQKIGNGEKTLWIVLLIASLFINLLLVVSLIYFFLIYRNEKTQKK